MKQREVSGPPNEISRAIEVIHDPHLTEEGRKERVVLLTLVGLLRRLG